MSYRPEHPVIFYRTALLATLLALPLAACSERPPEPETDDATAVETARSKEAERRPGSGEPEIDPNDVDYTDEYSEPRESWTGDNTARVEEVADIARSDARAGERLAQALSGRDGFDAVEVEVKDGVAHLEGEVATAMLSSAAESLALELDGVVAVRNDLLIRTGAN